MSRETTADKAVRYLREGRLAPVMTGDGQRHLRAVPGHGRPAGHQAAGDDAGDCEQLRPDPPAAGEPARAVVTPAGIYLAPAVPEPPAGRVTFTSTDEEVEAERCRQADALTDWELAQHGGQPGERRQAWTPTGSPRYRSSPSRR